MNQNINYIGMVNLSRHLQNADLVRRKDLRPAPGGDWGRHHISPLYYNSFTVQGTAASHVFFRIVAQVVRMRESWPDVFPKGPCFQRKKRHHLNQAIDQKHLVLREQIVQIL